MINAVRDDSMTSTTTKTRRQRVYEQLGAPSLVYRHEPSYSFTVDDGQLVSRNVRARDRVNIFSETWQNENRFKTRWNFPIDQHYVQSVEVEVKKQTSKPKKSPSRSVGDQSIDKTGARQPKLRIAKSKRSQTNFDDISSRTLSLLQAGRLTMLLETTTDVSGPKALLENYAMFDYPYFDMESDTKKSDTKKRKGEDISTGTMSQHDVEASRAFSNQRRFAADPSYLAPFGKSSLSFAMTDDHDTAPPANAVSGQQHGNCLVCFPCPCPPCTSPPSNQNSWCLIHPIGDLLDRMCASNLIPPNGRDNAGSIYPEETWLKLAHCRSRVEQAKAKYRNEVDVDDTVLQLVPCGSWMGNDRGRIFAARTSTHVSLLRVTVEKAVLPDRKDGGYGYDDNVCWGNYPLQEVRRLDLRSLSRMVPSYRPVYLAAHPNYGNALSNPKFAFVSHCSQTNASNVIHHASLRMDMATSMPKLEMHTISNLKAISLIDFSSSHPMCLWSAGKSYVTPAVPASSSSILHPCVDFGTALYNIDLRTDSAAFQWSPSGTEFLPEGIHSISGIMTDWQSDHKIWVRSTSAGKTWEIDDRMPCKVVNEWALPSTCDDVACIIPRNGLHGDGALLVQPDLTYYKNSNGENNTERLEIPDPPILSVDKTPGAFGLHLYQRPENRPRFATKSLECISTPGLSFSDKMSIATSTVVPLPDVSDNVFISGVATLRTSISEILSAEQVAAIDGLSVDDSVLCPITLTNKGDIYLHALLESCSDKEQLTSHQFQDLPLGSRVIAVPVDLNLPSTKDKNLKRKPVGGMNLRVRLDNQCPIPGGIVVSSTQVPPSVGSQGPTFVPNFPEATSRDATIGKDEIQPLYIMEPQRLIGAKVAVGKDGKAQPDEPSILPNILVKKSTAVLSSFSSRFYEGNPQGIVKREALSGSEGDEPDEKRVISDITPDVFDESRRLWDEIENDSRNSEI